MSEDADRDARPVHAVLLDVIRDPVTHIVRRWNWKASVLSSATRATIFLVANLPAGISAGLRAMAIEFGFRAVASGVLGSLTQSLARARPAWAAATAALILMPALGHAAEYAVHASAGTPRLSSSLAASVAFTCVSTLFNLFVMRRGVLIVGVGAQSLVRDVRALPGLIAAFAATAARLVTGRRGPL